MPWLMEVAIILSAIIQHLADLVIISALPLFLAVIITQTIATLIVVYGILLPAIGWGLAAFIGGYALIAFVITDYIKVYSYKLKL